MVTKICPDTSLVISTRFVSVSTEYIIAFYFALEMKHEVEEDYKEVENVSKKRE